MTTTTFGLLILLAAGPQVATTVEIGLDGGRDRPDVGRELFPTGHLPVHPRWAATAVEVSPAGIVRSVVVDAESTVSPSLFERGSAIRKSPPSEPVDTAQLCGQSCQEVLDGGVPCRAVYVPPCEDEPEGFVTGAKLYDICPYACPPETRDEESSLVWLWVLLGIGLPLIVLGVVACLFLPKQYITSPWDMIRWGRSSYESHADENNEYKAGDSDIDDGGARASQESRESQGASRESPGSSPEVRDSQKTHKSVDLSQPRKEALAKQGINDTMMPTDKKLRASTMSSGGGGATGTVMMPTTMLASATTMMPGGTTMMPSGTNMVLQEEAAMMGQPTMVNMSSSKADLESTDTL